MRTPFHSKFEPLELRSSVIFFHDWRYVYHGGYRWVTDEGAPFGLWGDEPVPDLRWGNVDIPRGIRLRALPAQKSEPFLSVDQPWEGSIGAPTVIREHGTYRLWYEVTTPDDMLGRKGNLHNLLCYAESKDAATWDKPSLGQTTYHDSAECNIVYGGAFTPDRGYHGGSVFVDPNGGSADCYKAFHLGQMSREALAAYREKYPESVDPHSLERERPHALFGAASPDGIHWQPLPEPLVAQGSDTQNVAYYDELLGTYVGYFRTWVLGRRAIGRAESEEFGHFPVPETILWPDAGLHPSDLWYANGKTVYPGTTDYHLLFPKRWRVAEDRFYVHIMTSPDGILWGFPQESQILAPGERGAWDTGGVSASPNLVDLPGDRVGFPFTGYRVPHKYPRRPPLGELAWASWERGRLVALEAAEQGEFRTPRVLFKGNELHLNVRTNYVGDVRVELVGPDGETLAGRAFEDCDPVSGNFLDRTVTWNGEAHFPHEPAEPMAFRVRLSSAQLFGMSFQ